MIASSKNKKKIMQILGIDMGKIMVPQNGWFIMENPLKMHDLGGFPPIFGNTHMLDFRTTPLIVLLDEISVV